VVESKTSVQPLPNWGPTSGGARRVFPCTSTDTRKIHLLHSAAVDPLCQGFVALGAPFLLPQGLALPSGVANTRENGATLAPLCLQCLSWEYYRDILKQRW